MEAIKKMDYRGWRSQTVDITFPKSEGPAGLEKALVRICAEVTQALEDGYKMLVLSDRGEETQNGTFVCCAGKKTGERTSITGTLLCSQTQAGLSEAPKTLKKWNLPRTHL